MSTEGRTSCAPEAAREPIAVLKHMADSWLCLVIALLLAEKFTCLYGARDLWLDPSTEHALPLLDALRRVRKDAATGPRAAHVRQIERGEELLVRAAGWTSATTEHGTVWCSPDGNRHARTLAEAFALVLAFVYSVGRESDLPSVGLRERHMVRGRYDQRTEGQEDEVAQAPADPTLDAWMDRPRGMEGRAPRVGGPVMVRDRMFVRHSDSVAPDDDEGLCP
jgi:hypothetical protein